MSFLDDVDALEQRIQGKSISPMVLIAIVAVVLVVLFFIAQAALGALTTDSFTINANEASQAEVSSSESEFVEGVNQGSNDVISPDIVVYVTGEVMNPGVYTLVAGSRINDAIESAGGVTSRGVLDGLNLAEPLSDGMQITVLSKSQAKQLSQSGIASTFESGSSGAVSGASSSGKVNINTASATELQSLKGIGPALSERIVEYRAINGKFSKIEDLKNVSGIGDKTYDSLAADICV